MNKCKKVLIVMLIISNCFITSGCFSYTDINKVLFVTACVIDVDSNGSPVVYTEAFKGVRGQGAIGIDERLLFKGKGKTTFEAVRNMAATSSFKLNYTQNKAIVFTQKAAEHGLDDFMDFFDRDQELLIRPYIVIYIGDPEKLMSIDLKQEKYVGPYVLELIENIGTSSRAIKLTLNEFYTQRMIGDKTNVIPIIDIPKDSLEAKLEVNGGAVVKNDKMISVIQREEGQGFNFLMNNLKGGTLEITNPCSINKFITLEILSSKTKTEIIYDGNVVHLKKKIKVKTNIAEAQKIIEFNEENIEKIQEKAQKNIEQSCKDIFEKYKEMGTDIFDLEQEFYGKYGKHFKGNIIEKTQLEVDVQVEVMNTGDTKNFR